MACDLFFSSGHTRGGVGKGNAGMEADLKDVYSGHGFLRFCCAFIFDDTGSPLNLYIKPRHCSTKC